MKPISQLDLSRKELIIFDLDGTLMDSVGVWNEIDQQLIQHFSGRLIDLETIQNVRDGFIGKYVGSGDDLYPAYGGFLNEYYNFNSSAEEVWNWRLKTAIHYLSEVFDFKPHADKVLNLLKQRGFKLALATNSIGRALDMMKQNKNFAKASFDETFDFIISSSDVKKRKPAPDMYLKVLEHFGVTADKCLVFEDALDGVTAANAAGIEIVNVYDKYSDDERDEINKLVNYRIDSYEEILNVITPVTRSKGRIKKTIEKVTSNSLALYLSFFEIAWYKKIVAIFFLLYAASPIDFVPDFIPVLGLFDDIIILSFGIWLCRKMIPKNIWDKNCEKVKTGVKIKTKYKVIGSIMILSIWTLIITLIILAIV